MFIQQNYVILDFETANNKPESICQIGMIKVSNGQVIDTYEILVKPDPYYFSSMNIQIHGITKDDVKDALTFSELYESVVEFIDGNIIVAHFAQFDMNCLYKSMVNDIFDFSFDFACSCRIAQELIPSHSHKLTYLSQHITQYNYQAHDALEDCYATFELLNYMFNNFDVPTLINTKFNYGNISKSNGYTGFKYKKK